MSKKKNSKMRGAKKLRNAKKRTEKASRFKRISSMFNKEKADGMLLSFCMLHGPYSADNLCACYDTSGKMDGKTYTEEVESAMAEGEVAGGAFCPLHDGEEVFDVDDDGVPQCGCYDEAGNRIKTPTGESIH